MFDYKRLDALVKETGKSKAHLCRALGRSEYYLRDAKKVGTEIKGRELEILARELGTSPEYLTGRSDKKTPPAGQGSGTDAQEIQEIYASLNDRGQSELCRYGRYLTGQPELRREREKPKVEYIRHYLTAAAAGYAAPIEGEDYELIPRDENTPAKADFCIDIAGDSMEPYIRNGQKVYVQRGADLKEFEVGIFFVDGDVYCKQWCVDFVGTLYLLSANPKREDANITISKNSGRSVVCFGKVLLDRRLPRPIYP